MSVRKEIRKQKRCLRQNLRLFKGLRRRYFIGADKDYSRVLVCVMTQVKDEQEKLDELQGRY